MWKRGKIIGRRKKERKKERKRVINKQIKKNKERNLVQHWPLFPQFLEQCRE